jgi:HTH-type transcriptional regulator/antitoxin MqsA
VTERNTSGSTRPCHICGAGAYPVQEERERSIGGRRVRILDVLYRCPSCGEEFYTAAQARASDRRATDALHEQHGALHPKEIRAPRERLGLTQADFEHLLGVGANTVSRWENGHVWPNAATNALLRLLEADPQNAQRLAG